MKIIFMSSSHLEDRIWFKDDDDFRTGMNCVALAALKSGARVIVFVLMSNHVHFLLLVDKMSQSRLYFDIFKNLYSMHMRKKYGLERFLRENKCDFQEIFPSELESVERVIAYILMNPVAANIVLTAAMYPWGCGDCFFSMNRRQGRKAGNLGVREKRRLLRTALPIPDNFFIEEGGYILPESYICKDFVQSVFRTPKRMAFFLNNSSKAKLRMEGERASLPSFRDQSIVILAQDIALSLFRKDSFEKLEGDERRRMIQEVKRRSSADIRQLSRVLSLSPVEIADLQ